MSHKITVKTLTILTLFLIVSLPFSFAQNTLQTGLYAYYPFNNTNDYFQNYNGTGTGEVNIISDGFNGQALEINQSTTNSNLAIDSIPMPENVTVNCWLYPTSDGTFFGRTVGAYAKPHQVIGNSDGNFQIFIGNGVSQTPTTTSNVRFTQDEWKMYTVYISSDEDVAELWVNAEQNFSQSNTGNYADDTAIDLLLGARNDFGSPELTAVFDECSWHDRNLTLLEKQTLYNSGAGNFTWYFNVSVPEPEIEGFTSFEIADFNISDITFSTSTYFDAVTIFFNTSETLNLTLFNAINIDKTTGSGINNVYGQLQVDDQLINDELLRTVTGTDQIGSAGFKPQLFQVDAGEHNITIRFRRDGNGNIEISNIDLLLQKMTTGDGDIVVTDGNFTLNHTGTEFQTILAYNFTYPNLHFGKWIINSSVANINKYYFSNLDGIRTPLLERYISAPNTFGSLGGTWAYGGNNLNYILNASASVGETSINLTGFLMGLRTIDNSSNISFNQNSDSDTTFSLNKTLTSSGHVVELNHTKKHGDSIMVSGFVTFKSLTGEQTPIFRLNSTNKTDVTCTSKARYLSSNEDIGNVYLMCLCNGGLAVNSTYEYHFDVELESGEQLEIIDENIVSYDTTIFDISRVTPDISLNLLTDLVNNSINVNVNPLEVNFNFSLGSGNTIDLVNCDFIFNDTLQETQYNLSEGNEYQFSYDTTLLTLNTTIELQCYNDELNQSSGIYNYNIDTEKPEIEINTDFVNESQYIEDQELTLNISCFDLNLFSFNMSIVDSNNNLWNNELYYAENLTVNLTTNITSRFLTDLGNYSIIIECTDSHTDNKVKNKYWENTETGVLIESLSIDGDIKNYNKKGETITYFYKDIDRYKFKITFNEKNKIHYLNLTANDLIYLPYTKYKGHFILEHKYAVDFEGSNVKDVTLNYDGYYKEIKIELYNSSDEIEFESVFDLNVKKEIYKYSVVSELSITNNLINSIVDILNNLGDIFMMILYTVILLILYGIYFFVDIEDKMLLNFIVGIGYIILFFKFNTLGEEAFVLVSGFGFILIWLDILEDSKLG